MYFEAAALLRLSWCAGSDCSRRYLTPRLLSLTAPVRQENVKNSLKTASIFFCLERFREEDLRIN